MHFMLSSPKPFEICTSTYIVLYISLDIYCNSRILYFDIFPHLIFSTSCILYIGHHSWHMVGSVLTYSGLSALHKKLSQKLVNLPSTNAGCQLHKKVGNSVICKWSKTFVFCHWLGLVLLALWTNCKFWELLSFMIYLSAKDL